MEQCSEREHASGNAPGQYVTVGQCYFEEEKSDVTLCNAVQKRTELSSDTRRH